MGTKKGRKVIAKNRTELADVLNKIDGLYQGISRAEFRKALKIMEALETALIMRGYKSAALVIRRIARKKAITLKAKAKK